MPVIWTPEITRAEFGPMLCRLGFRPAPVLGYFLNLEAPEDATLYGGMLMPDGRVHRRGTLEILRRVRRGLLGEQPDPRRHLPRPPAGWRRLPNVEQLSLLRGIR